MPGRINTSREDGVIYHIHFLSLPIVGDDSTAFVLAGMKLHAFRVVLLVVMAVNALCFFLKTAEHIVINHTFVVILQTTLIDGQCLITNKRGVDKTIA